MSRTLEPSLQQQALIQLLKKKSTVSSMAAASLAMDLRTAINPDRATDQPAASRAF